MEKNAFKASPETLAREIWEEAYLLVEKFAKMMQEKGVTLTREQYQDALIGFSQTLLLASSSTYKKISPEEAEDLEREIFLALGRIILEDFLEREPTEAEYDYFITYFRSGLELLRKEISQETETDLDKFGPDLRKYIQFVLSRLLAKMGEVSH
ncbi:hypothetical protein [Thermodesulfatator atlanticus]|uniref:hypothetical protein n=1 Tax=Thermodesulfatator atlanticus TaxID=501497 RepID=UPI0003B72DAC|nr:hypothetical protein [Thermodesulfatator atlanticus]